MNQRTSRSGNEELPGGERRSGDVAEIAAALLRRGRISLRVHGSSMLPWVRPGDISVIRTATPETVRCGDLVLFRQNQRLYVHRMVEKHGPLDAPKFLAKGDAHPTSDGRVGQEEILGRVVRLYRGGRRIDMETPGQLALGLVISQLSRHSGLWLPMVWFGATVTRPARRIWHALRPSVAAIR